MTDPTPTHPETAAPSVVFLIGAPRSGTTWLQSLLGSHAAIVTPQETDLFSTFIGPLQNWWDRQLDRSADEQQSRRTKGLPAVLDDDEFSAMLAGFVSHVLDRIRALDPAATVIVEKSPSHSRHTDLIARYLPDAAFIHLIRDGRDVVESLQSASRGWGRYWAPGGMKDGAEMWRTSVTAARRAERTGRYVEVRYEQLRGGDVEPLQRAFALCGQTVDAEHCRALLAEYSLDRMASGAAASPIAVGGEIGDRANSRDEPSGFYGKGAVGGWQTTWSRSDRLLVDAVAGDLLVELGYVPDHQWAGSTSRRSWYSTRVLGLRAFGRFGRCIGRRSERLLKQLP